MKDHWFMPEEGEQHERTWMSFGATEEIWGHKLIVMLNIDGIAAGGGGIHCATQQEPKADIAI